jgi:sugar/nucleoside kinase (ribokinase family)
MDFVTFNIIIDDIVFPDGRTAMGVLGGGGSQTAFGMKLWADEVGLVAGVGSDLPANVRGRLAGTGIDTQGLRHSKVWPTPRAWQVMEADGRRTQVWRVPGSALGPQLGRSLDKLPASYRRARGFHFGLHPEEADLDFVKTLREAGAVVSVETFKEAGRALTAAELQALVSAADIFSPNLLEASSLVGPGEPRELIRRLAEAGAEVIALRQGSGGATVHQTDTGETWDPVGAGNAFCGAFLVGWVQTADLRTAGLYGSVAASFLVEQVGLPEPRSGLVGEAKERLARLKAEVYQIR